MKITTVEIKDVELPDGMRHAIARRPRPSASGGEGHQRRGRVPGLRAAEGRRRRDLRRPAVAEAALPQTLTRSAQQSSTIVFPLPVDILEPLIAGAERAALRNGEQREQLEEAVLAARNALEAGNKSEPVNTD